MAAMCKNKLFWLLTCGWWCLLAIQYYKKDKKFRLFQVKPHIQMSNWMESCPMTLNSIHNYIKRRGNSISVVGVKTSHHFLCNNALLDSYCCQIHRQVVYRWVYWVSWFSRQTYFPSGTQRLAGCFRGRNRELVFLARRKGQCGRARRVP